MPRFFAARTLGGVFALLVALSPGFARPACAEVVDWSLAVFQLFDQTADDTAPTTPSGYLYTSQVATSLNGEFESVTLANVAGAAPAIPYFPIDFGGGPADFEIEGEAGTLAELNGVLPTGDYVIVTSGGTLGAASEPITLGDTFPTEVPRFLGSAYSDLQGFDPSGAIALEYNTPPAGGSAVFIIDVATGDDVFEADSFGDPSQTGVTIPAGVLEPNTQYELVVDFFRITPDPREGFATGEGLVGNVNTTILSFTTAVVPEPGSLMLLAIGGVGLLRRR